MNNLRIQLSEKFDLTEEQIDAVFERYSVDEVGKALKATVFRNRELFKMNLKLFKKYK